jgi:hypothetical protein
MTLITHELRGVSAIQEDSAPSNFYALDDGLAVYLKPLSGWGEGSFHNTYFPLESENISWMNVRCKLVTQADVATTNYKAVTQLYGILADGREELIAEDIDQTISTTETEREILFDVAASSSIPELAHLSLDGAVSGKSYLNLPLRYKFYDSVKLYPAWLDGWSYCKPVYLQGSNLGRKFAAFPRIYLDIPYATGMATDFSDVRFVHPDGKTFLCYDLLHYITSTSARFAVYIDTIPGYPNITPLPMFYGKSGATDKSSPSAVHEIYDTFEDGAYSGDRSPYYPTWTNVVGSASIESSNPISGVYSLKHTGDSSNNGYIKIVKPGDGGVLWDVDLKISSYGTGANQPYTVFYWNRENSDNYIKAYIMYSSPYTYIKVVKVIDGTSTIIGNEIWLSGQPTLNHVYHFSIIDTGSNISIDVDGSNILNEAYSASFEHGYLGVGACQNGAAIFDNYKISPHTLEQPMLLSIGSVMSNSAILPDGTPNPEDMQLVFTRPWENYPIPGYVYVDESGVDGINTNIVQLHNKGVYRLGPDGIDKYSALRVKSFVESDDNCNVTYSDFSYEYEVLE